MSVVLKLSGIKDGGREADVGGVTELGEGRLRSCANWFHGQNCVLHKMGQKYSWPPPGLGVGWGSESAIPIMLSGTPVTSFSNKDE